MARRGRIIAFGSAAALVVAGAVCAAVIGGMTGELIGLSLITLGLGAVVLLVFFEVGLSEDRELAREEERRRKQAPKHDDAGRRARRPRPPRRPG
jgi:NADH:ubiquinone oxidoreductase subunit 6 (subunit J)